MVLLGPTHVKIAVSYRTHNFWRLMVLVFGLNGFAQLYCTSSLSPDTGPPLPASLIAEGLRLFVSRLHKPGAPHLAGFSRDVGFHGTILALAHGFKASGGYPIRIADIPHLAKNQRDVPHGAKFSAAVSGSSDRESSDGRTSRSPRLFAPYFFSKGTIENSAVCSCRSTESLRKAVT